MEFKIVLREEIKVIGKEFRTTNVNGQGARDIPGFWQAFCSENMGELIPNKVEPCISLGIYTDYESDATGAYSFIIGYEVRSFENIPVGMVAKTIPAAKYAIITAKGAMPQAIGEAWQKIWMSNLERTYTGDFEVFDARLLANENPEVDIYIAVK